MNTWIVLSLYVSLFKESTKLGSTSMLLMTLQPVSIPIEVATDAILHKKVSSEAVAINKIIISLQTPIHLNVLILPFSSS